MKTKEELAALKEEVEALHKKLAELTEEELDQVTGGAAGASGISDEMTPFKIGDRFLTLSKSYEIIDILSVNLQNQDETNYSCKVWFSPSFAGAYDRIETRDGWELSRLQKV